MAPNETHLEPNAAITASSDANTTLNDAETVLIGIDSTPIGDSHQIPVIQVNPLGKSTDFNATPSTEQWPETIREPSVKSNRPVHIVAAAVASQSIRILVIIKGNEIGFEWLFDELSRFNDDLQRSKHVKRLLLSIATGMDAAGFTSVKDGLNNLSPIGIASQ